MWIFLIKEKILRSQGVTQKIHKNLHLNCLIIEIESATEFYHPINNKTHKEKKSYIFTKQLREFVEPKHGGVRNTKSIQPMIDYLMMKVDPDNGYQSITTWLCDELLLMNKDTYNIPYLGKSEIESFCSQNHITNIKLFCDYVSTAKSIMKQMFLRALSSMEKQNCLCQFFMLLLYIIRKTDAVS